MGNASSNVALKLVESAPFFKKDGESLNLDSQGECHSLHRIISTGEQNKAELAAHFVGKYSKKGDVVLDPFAGSGSILLEAALMGRVPYCFDANELNVRISRAKLQPADLTEVTLRLQRVNLKGPTDLKYFKDFFSPFFHIDTFCELLRLRAAIDEKYDRVGRFIELVALGILHGHSAGFLSSYTFPQFSLLPDEQHQLNLERRQTPEYRAVSPRILRKTALSIRDGSFSPLEKVEPLSKIGVRDARDLRDVRDGEATLVLTTPPVPCPRPTLSGSWLRLWFAGLQKEQISPSLFGNETLTGWRDFMNESLLEMARVTSRGGRAVLFLRESTVEGESRDLAEETRSMVDRNLHRFWLPEGVIVNQAQTPKIGETLRERNSDKHRASRCLVLRRR